MQEKWFIDNRFDLSQTSQQALNGERYSVRDLSTVNQIVTTFIELKKHELIEFYDFGRSKVCFNWKLVLSKSKHTQTSIQFVYT